MNLYKASLLATVLTGAAACAPQTPHGIAYLRITERDGSCPTTAAYAESCPPSNPECAVTLLDNVEFRRAHATASFESGSRWLDGSLVVAAWQDPDGTIGRMYVDLGPDRGAGASLFPETPSLQQAIGYVEWQGGARKFEARKALATIDYVTLDKASTFNRYSVSVVPNTLYAHAAFDGVGPHGEALCRIIGMHAAYDRARKDPYDPSWLAPNPSVLFVDGEGPPSYEADLEPTAQLVLPAEAPSDPGGPPNIVHKQLPLPKISFGSGGCD